MCLNVLFLLINKTWFVTSSFWVIVKWWPGRGMLQNSSTRCIGWPFGTTLRTVRPLESGSISVGFWCDRMSPSSVGRRVSRPRRFGWCGGCGSSCRWQTGRLSSCFDRRGICNESWLKCRRVWRGLGCTCGRNQNRLVRVCKRVHRARGCRRGSRPWVGV